AGDGQEGLNLLAKDPNFKLILSDWNMPVMDGLSFVKGVRSGAPAFKNIPIVMVTTEGGEGKVNAALDAGANGHIKKPFTPETLQETLSQFLG
ncbi:MAG: response regulator, partial [Magnetococcales bacterium]|nr:response regulator [Magnetococcales bacterium]